MYQTISISFFQYLCRLITAKTLAIRGYRTTNRLKKIVMRIAGIVVGDSAMDFLVSVVRGLNAEETTYVDFFGRARYRNSCFPKVARTSAACKLLKLCCRAEHVEEYLELRYGPNYMEIPDRKTRDSYPSHAVLVDPDRDYSYYD